MPATNRSSPTVTETLEKQQYMATTTQTRRIVDIEGAAEHLTVTVRFMRTLVADRRVPHLKVGKFVRFDLDELGAWLDTCRVEAHD